MRRYEKNYLLYGEQTDLKENYTYTQAALEVLERFFRKAQHLQKAFLNLLMNAIQAIDEPPGEIRIAARVDLEQQQAVITVADNGCGIPREHLDRIFDPFFSTKEVGLGTGLGLSIVYGIIEKHQGTISVESRVGEGTRFTIRLPWQPLSEQRSAAS